MAFEIRMDTHDQPHRLNSPRTECGIGWGHISPGGGGVHMPQDWVHVLYMYSVVKNALL